MKKHSETANISETCDNNAPPLRIKEQELVQALSNYDESALSKAKVSWLFGQWQDLTAIEPESLASHPDRSHLALLVAAAHLQADNQDAARKFIRFALDWGCPPRVIAKILIAGVHNILGRIAALKQDEARIKHHFSRAVDVIAEGSQSELVSHARAVREMTRLGLLSQAAGFVEEELRKKPGDIRRPAQEKAKLDILKREIKTLNKTSCRNINYIQPNPYVHNRTLTPELNKELIKFFYEAIGIKGLKATYIDYLALKATEIEKKCVGRLATTIQDAVVRQIIAESVNSQSLCVMEIGALFGINLAILFNHCCVHFDQVKVIGIDPLSGYYGNETDAVLNTPITQNTFMRNMQLANVPSECVYLIQYLSTDSLAIKEAKNHKFNLLIIDGDHSYEGIQFDYENYFPLLEPGGYVIFDDYNAKEWPDVSEFVDKVVKNDPSCVFIGAFSRTAICRKRT